MRSISRIEDPALGAGRGIEGDDPVGRGREVERAVDHDRRGLERGLLGQVRPLVERQLAGLVCPGDGQIAGRCRG